MPIYPYSFHVSAGLGTTLPVPAPLPRLRGGLPWLTAECDACFQGLWRTSTWETDPHCPNLLPTEVLLELGQQILKGAHPQRPSTEWVPWAATRWEAVWPQSRLLAHKSESPDTRGCSQPWGAEQSWAHSDTSRWCQPHTQGQEQERPELGHITYNK